MSKDGRKHIVPCEDKKIKKKSAVQWYECTWDLNKSGAFCKTTRSGKKPIQNNIQNTSLITLHSVSNSKQTEPHDAEPTHISTKKGGSYFSFAFSCTAVCVRRGRADPPFQTTVWSVALTALRMAAAVVVASLEGNSMGGAEKRDANYFGKKAITIARAPSVIDHGVGPHRLCVSACWHMSGCGTLSKGNAQELLPLKNSDWVCAASYKKTANKEWLLWQKGLIWHRD